MLHVPVFAIPLPGSEVSLNVSCVKLLLELSQHPDILNASI